MDFEMEVVLILVIIYECDREKGSCFILSETNYQTRGSGKLCELAIQTNKDSLRNI